ncbi:MAG: hypothetical protein WAK01_19420 [Methylocystis sp.]
MDPAEAASPGLRPPGGPIVDLKLWSRFPLRTALLVTALAI